MKTKNESTKTTTSFTPGPWMVKTKGVFDRCGVTAQTPLGSLNVCQCDYSSLRYAYDLMHEQPPFDIDRLEEANARFIAAAPKMLSVLKRYEEWEAKLIEADEAWQGRNFAITDELYEEFMEIQGLRNEAIEAATGRSVYNG